MSDETTAQSGVKVTHFTAIGLGESPNETFPFP
jgi:hypothetical protein